MEGARELLLCFEMAAVTELRLLFLHQKLAFLGVMWRVAIGAADVVLQVRGAAKICVLFAILMAIQTAGTDFLCGNVLESKNLAFVATSIDVFLARPMTTLAAPPREHPHTPATLVPSCYPWWLRSAEKPRSFCRNP